jgi:hypothetical protein
LGQTISFGYLWVQLGAIMADERRQAHPGPLNGIEPVYELR